MVRNGREKVRATICKEEGISFEQVFYFFIFIIIIIIIIIIIFILCLLVINHVLASRAENLF